MRIAIFSHGHPEIRPGGAEIAAYALFRSLKAAGHDAVFVALAGREELGHDGVFGAFRGLEDEILWRRAIIDPLRVAAIDLDDQQRELGELLEAIAPEVAHFHHYFGFSADALDLTARVFGIPTFLTLHEYGAICAHFGQMVKSDGRLCEQWSPSECARCVDHTPGQMFLRRERLLSMFAGVAGFISPSRFLADRYVAWGLPEERISVIENITPGPSSAPRSVPPEGYSPARPLRLAYFGQFTPFKGLDVLIKAMALLPAETREAVRLTIYGGANGERNQAYFDALKDRIDALGPLIDLHGPYRNADVVALMGASDWVVVPSVWWENSPVVIQEAAAAGAPVLASDIGGLAEKVVSGVTGAKFLAGSAQALADRIGEVARGELVVVPDRNPRDGGASARVDAVLNLYASALAQTTPALR